MDIDAVVVELPEKFITQDFDTADIPIVENEAEYDGNIDFQY